MTIMFIGGRLNGEQRFNQPIAPIYEHPIEFKHHIICIERYENRGHGMSPTRMLAQYVGLRRSGELARRFDPARLR